MGGVWLEALPPSRARPAQLGSGHVVLGLRVRELDEALAIAAVFVVRHAVHLGRAQSRPPLSAVLLRDREKGELDAVRYTSTRTKRIQVCGCADKRSRCGGGE